ncbi:MAG TPA: glutamyl-tRNA reductase, partial [Bryobacteraceae bacterium]|nr:glutamyl-tRNA reductase [Bryobacteraceae bacterium]
AARHLYRSGASILVTNRTEARALDLARVVHGSVVPYDAYRQHLKDIDIIMTSSAAPDYLLRKDEMRRILDARRNRPVFLIDMAVPRNIEPAVNELDNVFLYDIDDLQKVVNDNMLGRLQAAEEAARIVEEEVDRLDAAMRTRSVGPVIVDLQDALERLRKSEIERVRSKLGDLTPQQEQALDQLTRGLMAKVAHGPIAALRRNAGDEAVIDRIRSIFRLDEEVAPALLRRK